MTLGTMILSLFGILLIGLNYFLERNIRKKRSELEKRTKQIEKAEFLWRIQIASKAWEMGAKHIYNITKSGELKYNDEKELKKVIQDFTLHMDLNRIEGVQQIENNT